MVSAIQARANKYKNVGYNKAAVAFSQQPNPLQGGFENDKLLLPRYHFPQTGVPIDGEAYDLYRQSKEVENYRQSHGKLTVCEGCTGWCYLIPSSSVGVDKYW